MPEPLFVQLYQQRVDAPSLRKEIQTVHGFADRIPDVTERSTCWFPSHRVARA